MLSGLCSTSVVRLFPVCSQEQGQNGWRRGTVRPHCLLQTMNQFPSFADAPVELWATLFRCPQIHRRAGPKRDHAAASNAAIRSAPCAS